MWTPADDSEAPGANADASTVAVGETDKKINTGRKEALDELETTLRRLVTTALNSLPSGSRGRLHGGGSLYSSKKPCSTRFVRRGI